MFNFDIFTNESNAEHNSKWPYIPDHIQRILIIGGGGGGDGGGGFWIRKNKYIT